MGIQQLVDLAHEVHKVLDELEIKHWLMFGSDFGVFKENCAIHLRIHCIRNRYLASDMLELTTTVRT